MHHLFTALTVTGALLLSTTAPAGDPAYLGHYESAPEDVNAIMQLTKDFRAALVAKNARQLSTLVFNSNILFASPPSAATVKQVHDTVDVNFDGVPAGGFWALR